jgi:hypothetical protein
VCLQRAPALFPLLLVPVLPQADQDAAVESTVAALESRCARLAAELEDAAVALEVCRAKAGMYDDLQAKAERLVSEESIGTQYCISCRICACIGLEGWDECCCGPTGMPGQGRHK